VTEATPIAVSWSRHVPAALRDLSTLSAPDYADTFSAVLPEPPGLPPASLVHASFAVSPRWLRLLTPLAQRFVLGFHIASSSSPDHPLGWEITGGGDNWLRVDASSSFLSGQVVGLIDGCSLSIAAFVRYDRALGRMVWPPVSLVHRQVGITLLRSAPVASESVACRCGVT
jgi:hypothetical protein